MSNTTRQELERMKLQAKRDRDELLDAPPGSEKLRIFSRCPACRNDTLTINKGRLLCTWHECPDPVLIDKLGDSFAVVPKGNKTLGWVCKFDFLDALCELAESRSGEIISRECADDLIGVMIERGHVFISQNSD